MDNVIWLVLLIAFVMVEAATVSVVSLWFAAGALAALVAAMLGAQLWLQVLLFAVVSAVLLIALRPVIRKHFTPKLTRTNVDAIVGKTCLCVTAIDNLAASGQVKIGDVEWTARSTTGEPIAVGTQVKVDRVEGVKVYVTPVTVKV
jgi:membrane protein implicated in regulation of membrane protease activity